MEDQPKQKKTPQRPKNKAEGAQRICSYVRYLYDEKARVSVFLPAMVEAMFLELAGINDPKERKTALRYIMERAYADLNQLEETDQ